MGCITTYGLEQEHRLKKELCITHSAELLPRGVTPEKLQDYGNRVTAMEIARAAANQFESAKQQLTILEKAQRELLSTKIRAIREVVKKKFGRGNPVLKDFHVGDALNDSTSVAIGWVRDYANNFPKHKESLASHGILQADIDDLVTLANALGATDTQQELAKSEGGPDATAVADAAEKAVISIADEIDSAARMAFAEKPAILAQFEATTKKRFEQDPRSKQTPEGGGAPAAQAAAAAPASAPKT